MMRQGTASGKRSQAYFLSVRLILDNAAVPLSTVGPTGQLERKQRENKHLTCGEQFSSTVGAGEGGDATGSWTGVETTVGEKSSARI